jgi:hypothetical protein
MKVLERERGGWVVVVDIRSSGGNGKSNKSQRMCVGEWEGGVTPKNEVATKA